MTVTPSYVVPNTGWPLMGLQAAFAQPANSGAIAGPWDDLIPRPPVKISTTMGTQHELAQAPSGTLDLTLRDTDEYLNPANGSSPWNSSGKALKPYRRIRWWAMWPWTGNIVNSTNDTWAALAGVSGSFADTASFDGGTVGTWTVTAGCTIAADATHVHDGAGAMRVTWATTAGGSGVANLASPLPPVQSGTTYTASAWVWIGSGPAVTLWCNGNTATSTTTTGAWQRVAVTFAADSTIVAGIGLYSAGATTSGQQVWVDSVQVEAAASASAFTTSGPTVYTLFQGHIERYPISWQNAGFEAWADLGCVDAAAMMPRVLLRDVATAETLVDAPDQYWPLWDQAGAGTPQNLGVNAGQASGMAPYSTQPAATYGGLLTTFTHTGSTASTVTTASFAATAGTMLVLTCGSDDYLVSAVTSSGDTSSWTQVVGSSVGFGTANIWYATVTSTGSITVTVTFAGAGQFAGWVTAWSGLAPTTPMPSIAVANMTTSVSASWTAPSGSNALLVYGAYTTAGISGIGGISGVGAPVNTSSFSAGTYIGAGPYRAGTQSYSFNASWTGGPPRYAAVQVDPPPAVPGGSYYTAFGAVDGPDVDGNKALQFAGSQQASTYWASDWSTVTVGGNNAGWTVDAWFQATPQASPWTERILTAYGPSASEAGLYLDATGALHYQHLNTSGTVDATIQAPGLWQDGAWHHVAISETSTGTTCTSTLYVDGQALGSTTRSGVTATVYGVRLGYDYAGATGVFVGAVARVGVYWTNGALGAARVLAHWKAGRDGWLGDTPGQRLARAITWGGWEGPTALTGTNAGRGTLGPAVGLDAKYVSDVAAECAATENGDFLVNQAGQLTLQPRSAYYQNITTVWTMGEHASSGEYPYMVTSTAELDPAYIYNDVTVSADKSDHGQSQTSYNVTSQSVYGTRTLSISTSHQFDGDAKSLADWTVLDQGDAYERVSAVVFDPSANPALWPLVLGVRFGDRVTWNRRSPGCTTTIQGWVEQVEHDVTPGQWTTTLAIRSVEAVQAGIVGDATYGLIGSTLVSVY